MRGLAAPDSPDVPESPGNTWCRPGLALCWIAVSVGLVLGGGGVTGAAYELATLMALEIATGWSANRAEVIVGTSAGAFVTALVRSEALDLDSLIHYGDSRTDVAERIGAHLFQRTSRPRVGRWLRHGVLPGVRKPGLTMLLGSPAPWTAGGVGDWVRLHVGLAADAWPSRATVITAYDVAAKRRVAFGTESAPEVSLADAVAASSAIPLVFAPWEIDGRFYVDGGVVSGTHADLLLGSTRPLDLVLVMAPMAAEEEREGAWLHEKAFDRVGRSALDAELDRIRRSWPNTEVVVFRPSPHVLATMRPNYLDPKAAVPTFIRTLVALRRELAAPPVWPILERHLIGAHTSA